MGIVETSEVMQVLYAFMKHQLVLQQEVPRSGDRTGKNSYFIYGVSKRDTLKFLWNQGFQVLYNALCVQSKLKNELSQIGRVNKLSAHICLLVEELTLLMEPDSAPLLWARQKPGQTDEEVQKLYQLEAT